MNTISRIAAIALGILTVIGARAQSPADTYAFDSPFWGLRASVDLSCPGKWSQGATRARIFGPGAGASLGAVYNYPVGGGVFIEPGVSVFYDTMDADYVATVPDAPWQGIDRLDAWVGTLGMRIPVTAGYRIDFTPSASLFLSTGPQLEIGFTSRLSDDMPGGSSLAGELFDSLLRRVDCQWKFCAAVALGYSYHIGVEAAIGMVNLSRHSATSSFHRNMVQLTFGYNF